MEKINNLEELNQVELLSTNGGDKFSFDFGDFIGGIFGDLCQFASYDESNTVQNNYIGRGR